MFRYKVLVICDESVNFLHTKILQTKILHNKILHIESLHTNILHIKNCRQHNNLYEKRCGENFFKFMKKTSKSKFETIKNIHRWKFFFGISLVKRILIFYGMFNLVAMMGNNLREIKKQNNNFENIIQRR